MTTNQIAYANLLETRRHNRATEGITAAHNIAQDTVSFLQYGETNRSNLVREGETQRHNKVLENVSLGELAETERSNRAREAENVRHNKEGEELSFMQVVIDNERMKADVGLTNARTAEQKVKNIFTGDLLLEQYKQQVEATNQAKIKTNRDLYATTREAIGIVSDVGKATGSILSLGAIGGTSARAASNPDIVIYDKSTGKGY